MAYLTVEEVNKAAEESVLAAFDCSIRHWEEYLKMTKIERLDYLFRLSGDSETLQDADLCSLCCRYRSDEYWGMCPLAPEREDGGDCQYECCDEYFAAARAMRGQPHSGKWDDNVVDKINALINVLKNKRKEFDE